MSQQAPDAKPSGLTVSVDHLSPCKKLLRVEVAPDTVNAAFDDVTAQFQKHAQLPGFRPGKVPRHLIAKSFESRIQEEARKKVFDDAFRNASQQEKLRVIVTLNVDDQQFGRGMPYSFNVTLEVAPEFELPEYKGLKARRELAVASDADVERAANILREQQVKYNDVARPVQTGDIVVVNYHGTSEGKPLTDFNATARGLTQKEGFWIPVAEGSFIPGFTEQLVGATAGEKRTVNVTFPADFVTQELAGRQGAFEVELLQVKEKVLPEVNDEFVKSLGAQSVEELMAGIRRDLQNELEFRQKRSVRDQLLQELMGRVQFELPESVIASETRNLVYNIVNQNQQRGVAPELIEQKKDEIFQGASSSAKDRVKAGFLLSRIAEKEGIKADQKEIIARVQGLAEQNKVSMDRMIKTIQERNGFPEIQQDIVTSKVIDLLETLAQVEEVPVTRV